MRGIAFAALVVILSIVGITVAVVYHQAEAAYRAAHDGCLNAGGAWLPRSPHSFAGTCLAHPG